MSNREGDDDFFASPKSKTEAKRTVRSSSPSNGNVVLPFTVFRTVWERLRS